MSWFTHLKEHLEQQGYVPCKVDQCLFINHDKKIFCLVYIDDVVWIAPDRQLIDKVLESLKDEFEMTMEGDVMAFLGIQFKHLSGGEIEMQQIGLIKRVLKATGSQDCNPDKMPTSQKPLGTDKNGLEFAEQWSYSSAVGMLLNLAANSCPEIAYVVHQCARFTHNPKASHGAAMKLICRYFQGTKTKGLILKPSKQLTVDCFADADFTGQWNVENPEDPLCVKSRMGYVLLVGNCPVHWVSKLQSEISVSTMEAEYISLSMAMRDLIPLDTLVDKVKDLIGASALPYRSYSKVFEDNNGTLILASTPQTTPHSKHIAVKYHFFKEHVQTGWIQLVKVESANQKADCLTKGLEKTMLERACKMLCGW